MSSEINLSKGGATLRSDCKIKATKYNHLIGRARTITNKCVNQRNKATCTHLYVDFFSIFCKPKFGIFYHYM